VLVFGSVHVGAELVGSGPKGLFDVVQHADENFQNWLMFARLSGLCVSKEVFLNSGSSRHAKAASLMNAGHFFLTPAAAH
jgi:hypothetical protein